VNILRSLIFVGFVAAVTSGCASVNSAMPGATNLTGEAWYSEAVGLPGAYGFKWAGNVFYCPAPLAAEPVVCKQAKMVPLTQADLDAEAAQKAQAEAASK
jgi:hypothetical protein